MASNKELARLNREIMDKFLSDLIEVVKKDCEDYFIKKMQHATLQLFIIDVEKMEV